jgi:hypothetical protein
MNIRICDHCGERKGVLNIPLTNRPNDEATVAEICLKCMLDIVRYYKEQL